MARLLIIVALVVGGLALAPIAVAQTPAQNEVNRLIDGMIAEPYDIEVARRLIGMRSVSTPLILAHLDGTIEYFRSPEYQRDYTAALMMRPPVRRAGEWVQPLVLPMNPADHVFVALCGVLTAMGEQRGAPRIANGLMYNQTLSHFAGEVLHGFIASLQAGQRAR